MTDPASIRELVDRYEALVVGLETCLDTLQFAEVLLVRASVLLPDDGFIADAVATVGKVWREELQLLDGVVQREKLDGLREVKARGR